MSSSCLTNIVRFKGNPRVIWQRQVSKNATLEAAGITSESDINRRLIDSINTLVLLIAIEFRILKNLSRILHKSLKSLSILNNSILKSPKNPSRSLKSLKNPSKFLKESQRILHTSLKSSEDPQKSLSILKNPLKILKKSKRSFINP